METVEIRIKSLRAIAKQSDEVVARSVSDVATHLFHRSKGLPRNDSCTVSFLFVCIRVKNLVEICG